MNKPLKKIAFVVCNLLCLFITNAQSNSNILKEIGRIYDNGNYSQSLLLAKQEIQQYDKKNLEVDSITLAQVYFYKGASEYYLQDYLSSIKSYNLGISFCPKKDEGQNLKGELIYERAFSEYQLEDYSVSYESSKQAALAFENARIPNYDYLISIYADIAGTASELGFMEEADSYLKKAEQFYETHKNKFAVIKNEASKTVLLQYKAIEIINNNSKLSNAQINKIDKHLNELGLLKRTTTFNAQEQRMYALALNLVGDCYLRKVNATKVDYKNGRKLIEKALQNLNKEYREVHYVQFMFNKIKAIKLIKDYKRALQLMQDLIETLPKSDPRLSFFEAEKANIWIKLNNKTEALNALKKSVGYIHFDSIPLRMDFSNFKPSYQINETGLLVEMADIITKQFPEDSTVLSFGTKLYRLGLIQFKNCYKEQRFNKKLKAYYDGAIGGILRLKTLGYGYREFDIKDLLNTMETIENKLVWKSFLKNRKFKNKGIPDSLFSKELAIRKSLVTAKINNDTLAIFNNERELKRQQQKIAKLLPSLSDFVQKPFDISSLQNSLLSNSVVLKYKKIGLDLYLFKITHNEVDFLKLKNSEQLLRMLQAYYTALTTQQETKVLAKQLYKQLFPFNTELYTNYTIIPDNILYHIPFETLIDSTNTYLMDNTSIRYTTHLVFVNEKIEKTVQNDFVLTIFSPKYASNKVLVKDGENRSANSRLLGAEEEAKQLEASFKSKLYQDSLATKENFIANAGNATILHLAMHANFNNSRPELSHLLFNSNTDWS